MVADALAQFQSQVTKAAFFRGTGIPFPGGTPRRGGVCRVIYGNATSTTTNVCTFSCDVSRDGGSTWQQEFVSDPINLTTVAQSGEIFIPYRVVGFSPPTAGPAPQVALSINFTGAGTPSVAYVGDNVTGGPA